MLDLFTKWPVRLGILSALVSAAAAGDCGRPTYTSAGGAGATASALQGPVYRGNDTAQTTVAASAGQGAYFNPGDANELQYASAERNWSQEKVGWGIGALGYRGSYTTSQTYFGTNSKFDYQGLGGKANVYMRFQEGHTEFRYGAQVGAFREWGQWPDFRASLASSSLGRPVQQFGGLSGHGYLRLDGAAYSIPRRRWAPTIGGGLYGLVTQGRLGLGAQMMIGTGPLKINAAIITLGSLGGTTPFQLGLSAGLPPYPKR